MRIAIISDTHNRLSDAAQQALEGLATPGLDLIIHAGDIGSPIILDALEAYAPVRAVLGNCDWDEFGAAVGPTLSLELEGVRIFVSHTPIDAGAPCDKRYPADGERGHIVHRAFVNAVWNREREMGGILLPHLIVHGHTHVPRREVVEGITVLNPGSASQPKGGCKHASIAVVDLADGTIRDTRIIAL